jgi:hypothetical protein
MWAQIQMNSVWAHMNIHIIYFKNTHH